MYICLFQNINFAFMPEDDFGIKLKASKKLKIILFNTMPPLYYNSNIYQALQTVAWIQENHAMRSLQNVNTA